MLNPPDDSDSTAEVEDSRHSVASLESPLDPEDAAEQTPQSGRRRRRTYILVSAMGVVVTVVAALALIRVPYYRFSPGTLYPTESLITISGAKTYSTDGGQIDFTTVSTKKASVLEALLAHFDNAVELVDADKIDGTNPPEETRRINLEMMSESRSTAEVVALRKLGYPIEVQGSGALVKAVAKASPAEKVLKENDAIVAVDGQPIHVRDDAITALGKHKPGDTVTLSIESAPGEPQKQATATLESRCSPTAFDGTAPPGSLPPPPPTCSAEDAAKPILGVRLATRDTHFKLPFTMAIDTKDVGGPSAGLALTLGIIDVLTPGSLTGGHHVATTGTINIDDSVGPIGGIRQKTFLAIRQNVELFIVPKEEFVEAQGYAAGSGMKIVQVSTLDEALKALADLGGNTDVVQQAAKANSPGTVPN